MRHTRAPTTEEATGSTKDITAWGETQIATSNISTNSQTHAVVAADSADTGIASAGNGRDAQVVTEQRRVVGDGDWSGIAADQCFQVAGNFVAIRWRVPVDVSNVRQTLATADTNLSHTRVGSPDQLRNSIRPLQQTRTERTGRGDGHWRWNPGRRV